MARTAFRASASTVAMLAAMSIFAVIISSCKTEAKSYRVGVLYNTAIFEPILTSFKERMTELGYVEGKRIAYDARNPAGEQNKACVEDFIRSKSDLIFAFPTGAALDAKAAASASGIPVLFANANIEGMNLVDSILSPGKGITGVRYPGPNISVKRLEILSKMAPGAKRYFAPYLKATTIILPQLEALGPAARAAGIKLDARPFEGESALVAYFGSLPVSGPPPFDAVLMLAEPLSVMPDAFAAIAGYAASRRIPVGGASISSGGYASLFGVSTDNAAVGRQAADMADKILKGAQAGSIPVVSAEYFLELNLGAAKRLGIAIPEGIVKSADKVLR